jgi:hypothetical protein
MRFWGRELAGWVLVALGLFLFFITYSLLTQSPTMSLIVEAGAWSFLAFVIFRGGIHLLKVAVAARVSLHGGGGKGVAVVREAAAWLLVLAGLFVFLVTYSFLTQPSPKIIEAGPLAFIAFIIFRGGLHLLKVAMAARVGLHARQKLREQAGPPAREVELHDPRASRMAFPMSR